MGMIINAYKILAKKLQGKRQLWKPNRRRENDIKMDLEAIGVRMWIGFMGLRLGSSGGLF
jgi:hypothetical protein